MNNKLGYYVLLILFICTFSFIKVHSYSLPLKNRIIYIDPGHGGIDNGSSFNNILEDNINLEICYELKAILENKGAKVYMTRYDDYDLSNINAYRRKKSDFDNRIKLINNSDADIYISLHLNASTSSKWNGPQVFYNNINKNNKLLASNIQAKFDSKRKISKIEGKYMYDKINKTGVLVELGFLSNSNDRSILLNSTKRLKLLDDIATGIINYYN